MVARSLVTALACLVLVFMNFRCGFAFQSSSHDSVVSSPGQLASGQAETAPTTKAARTDDFRTPGPELRVKWETGKLSLDAEGVPLSDVLQAVSHQTGIEVTGAQGLSDRVFAHFARIDLGQALQELLTHVDYAILRAPSGSASCQRTRVVIFERAADSGLARSPVKGERNAQTAPSPVKAKTDAPTGPGTDTEEAKRLAIAAATDVKRGDRAALRKYLRDPDPAVQTAAFDVLVTQNKGAGIADLLAEVKNADDQPAIRLQALQLLEHSGDADEQTVMAALRDLLKDPDPALSTAAVQTLATSGKAEAMDALKEGLKSANPSTRLMIIGSVAQTEAGLPLLREAVSDPDGMVSSAAETLLQQALAGGTGQQ